MPKKILKTSSCEKNYEDGKEILETSKPYVENGNDMSQNIQRIYFFNDIEEELNIEQDDEDQYEYEEDMDCQRHFEYIIEDDVKCYEDEA